MLILDVNVLVAAHRPDGHPRGEEVNAWLEPRLSAVERVGVDSHVLSSLVRIVTNPRIYEVPSTSDAVLTFCQVVLTAPSVVPITASSRHWGVFEQCVRELRLVGNDVPDAYLAALALDHEATLVSMDRGFRRFRGLRLLDPLAV